MSDGEERERLTGDDEYEARDTNSDSRRSFRVPILGKIWNGPSHPRKPHVTMFFQSWQLFPEKFIDSIPKTGRIVLLVVFWLSWAVLNVILAHRGVLAISYEVPANADRAAEMDEVVVPLLSCGKNADFWLGPADKCGVDGIDCFDEARIGQKMTFRCPSDCGSSGWTYEPWQVGAYSAMREPVVVGGPKIYRGDSFICGAALHAGLISERTGGCGQLEWIGAHSNFESTASKDGKFHSIGFDAEFPFNFRFIDKDDPEAPRITICKDIRSLQTILNIFFFLVAAYFIPTASSCITFLGTMAMFGFWTVVLASNPFMKGGTPELNSELISIAFRRLLPCSLGLVYIYVFAARPQLEEMHASLSRCLFWGGGFTIGILENYVFGSLPLDRLMVSDLNAQPGAWLALGILVAIVAVIVIGQAYTFWLSGQFRKYFKVYIMMICILVGLGMWPNQVLRLHHYAFALLLLPGTSLQTTCSLFYQGLLVGLYISGVARWDFDSVLQTAGQLSRGAALADPLRDPKFTTPVDSNPSSFIIQWQQEITSDSTYGYSLVINDIERILDVNLKDMGEIGLNSSQIVTHTFNLTSWVVDHAVSGADQTWYIRVAVAALRANGKAVVGKYSAPLTVHADGSYDLN